MIQAKVIHTWQKRTKAERKELRRLAMRAKDPGMRCRCKIILALVQGKTPTKIGHGGLASKSQVYRVAQRFIENGLTGLADRREDNGERKTTATYEAELIGLIDESPQQYGYRRPTWTQELLILVLVTKTGIKISVSAMSRLLARLEIGLRRPKPIVNCPWKKARRTRRLRSIQRLVDCLPANEVVLYLDEVDIHLNPKIGPDWMHRGRQKKVLTPGCNQKQYLAGAWDPKTGRLTYVEGERKTSLLFLNLLYKLVTKTYADAKRIHLILDNYGIHDSHQVRLAMKSKAAEKLELHFLPPYCPDHNRIERIWKDLHDNVTRNHRCVSMDELMDDIRAYLGARNQCGHHKYARKKGA
ncbi:MAG: IS630 family transposase [Armatimonadota bacterium]